MTDNKVFNKEVMPPVAKELNNLEQNNETVTEVKVEKNSEAPVETNNLKETNDTAEVKNNPTSSTPASPQVQVVEIKSELRKAVERVMEADLRELYLTMTPAERQVFKKRGEETAREITGLIEKTKINLNKIIKLLFNWLRLIPKVNNFFIEQEAKLKADQLLKLPK